MGNSYFQFKQFTVHQDRAAMKVTTDACLFGAWVADMISRQSVLTGKILDIGAGTGLLSLMLSQKNPGFVIDAVEIDNDAAVQAKENAATSPWKDKIKVVQDDIRKKSSTGNYDHIISNPPFYENELQSPDDKKNAAHHCKDLSLSDLLAVIHNQLGADGFFFLLLPYKRNDELRNLMMGNNLSILRMVFVKQSVNHGYFRVMLMGSLNNMQGETEVDEIAIKDGNDQYTTRFVDLLKDYYLYL